MFKLPKLNREVLKYKCKSLLVVANTEMNTSVAAGKLLLYTVNLMLIVLMS